MEKRFPGTFVHALLPVTGVGSFSAPALLFRHVFNAKGAALSQPVGNAPGKGRWPFRALKARLMVLEKWPFSQ
jgi:hypothetical protein